ncbi:MAG: 30S ribosomal protein S20 [Bacillota bacterium]
MPQRNTAAKRARQAEQRRLRNAAIRSSMRTAIRRFREALASGNLEEAKARLQKAISMVDKAATKGAIHRNQADRRKARLQKHYNVARQQSAEQAS